MPPDCGNGLENAGIPLAKLLFFLKERPLMTLIEVWLRATPFDSPVWKCNAYASDRWLALCHHGRA